MSHRLDAKKLARVQAICDQLGIRTDANETAFLTRQIEHVRSQTFEVMYGPRLARDFLPSATDIPGWASYIVEVIYDSFGRAKVVAPGATDLPRVDMTVSESTYKVVDLGAAYGWTLRELEQAVGTNTPLSAKKAEYCKIAIDTGLDELLFNGKLTSVDQTVLGMVGIANHASVPIVASVNAGSTWVALDAAKILTDLNTLLSTVSQNTLQMFEANQIILPPREYDHIARLRVSTLGNQTVLQAFKETNPGVNVAKWFRLTGAGASGENRIIAYNKSPAVLEAIVPQEFRQLPPQVKGYETVINANARCGGVRWHHPKAAAYMDLDNVV